jgi:hypothetical protein
MPRRLEEAWTTIATILATLNHTQKVRFAYRGNRRCCVNQARKALPASALREGLSEDHDGSRAPAVTGASRGAATMITPMLAGSVRRWQWDRW